MLIVGWRTTEGILGAAATIFAVAAGTGCTPTFSRAQLSPVAHAGDPGSYVQVREIGSAPSRIWFWSGSSWRFGVTVDAINKSALPVSFDLAGARLELRASDGQAPAAVRAFQAGAGGLPFQIDGATHDITPLTLAPGEARTVWIVFDTVAPFPRNPEMTMTVPATRPESSETFVKVTVRAASTPDWTPRPSPTVNWGGQTRVEGRLYKTDGYEVGLEVGLWISRRPVRADLCLHFGDMFPSTPDGLVHGSTIGGTGSVAWHPRGVREGLYVEAGLDHVRFPDSAPFSDHWSPSAGGGIELGMDHGPAPSTYIRFGYIHSFRSHTPLTNGFLFAWGGSFAF